MNGEGILRTGLMVAVVLSAVFPVFAAGSHSVKGHMKKDGTYIAPHRQTNPDQLRRNNYSSEGNSNPYTGRQGKQRHELSNPPRYNDSYNNGQGKRLNQLYGNP